jgi:hypothetical protein
MTRRLKDDNGGRVPGLWAGLRQRHLDEIERGDPRLNPSFTPNLTAAERAELNARPGSSVSQARWALARMDEQGWVAASPPSRREFGATVDAISWLTDRSVNRIIVYRDDRVEPYVYR